MAGNAREWVQDWYDPNYYSKAPARNPKGPEQGILKVIRGGSWHHAANELRTTARGKGGFALRTDGVGFRCAQDLDGA
jgi:formylglycine-generating enzyme